MVSGSSGKYGPIVGNLMGAGSVTGGSSGSGKGTAGSSTPGNGVIGSGRGGETTAERKYQFWVVSGVTPPLNRE
ncbi:hypothetical protein D3C81_2230930 [compost metagenome]